MALIDKLESSEIAAHGFSAACLMWARGEITRQNVIDAFELETEDLDQLDAIAIHYAGLSDTEKAAFHGVLEAAGILLQGGYINKAKYISILGM